MEIPYLKKLIKAQPNHLATLHHLQDIRWAQLLTLDNLGPTKDQYHLWVPRIWSKIYIISLKGSSIHQIKLGYLIKNSTCKLTNTLIKGLKCSYQAILSISKRYLKFRMEYIIYLNPIFKEISMRHSTLQRIHLINLGRIISDLALHPNILKRIPIKALVEWCNSRVMVHNKECHLFLSLVTWINSAILIMDAKIYLISSRQLLKGIIFNMQPYRMYLISDHKANNSSIIKDTTRLPRMTEMYH